MLFGFSFACWLAYEWQTWKYRSMQVKLHGYMPLWAAKLLDACSILSGLLNAKHGNVGVCMLLQCVGHVYAVYNKFGTVFDAFELDLCNVGVVSNYKA